MRPSRQETRLPEPGEDGAVPNRVRLSKTTEEPGLAAVPPAGGMSAGERPWPPRYWWLKRLLVAAAVLMLALAGLHRWWSHEAQRRFGSLLEQYRAAGQPLTIEDFDFPPVPDDENAAHDLMLAAASLSPCSLNYPRLIALLNRPDLAKDSFGAVGQWINGSAPALALVRRARGKPDVDWGVRLTSPVVNMVFPQLSQQRTLAQFLNAAALYEHFDRKDDAAALELVHDTLVVHRSLIRWRGMVVVHVTGLAVAGNLCDLEIGHIAPTLRIGSTGTAARPAQVGALIADLLEDRFVRESWRWAVYAERAALLDAIGGTGAGTLGVPASAGNLPATRRLLGPATLLGIPPALEYVTGWALVADCPDFPAAQASCKPPPVRETGFQRNVFFLADILLPAMHRAAELTFRVLAKRRLAATALAIRWYETDHGAPPATLEALVPDYLPAVPADPFASGGRPIGYRPEAPRPLLYSFGANMRDDGGTPAYGNSGNVDERDGDLVFFLTAPEPPPREEAGKPASLPVQAVEHDGQIVHDPAQQRRAEHRGEDRHP